MGPGKCEGGNSRRTMKKTGNERPSTKIRYIYDIATDHKFSDLSDVFVRQ